MPFKLRIGGHAFEFVRADKVVDDDGEVVDGLIHWDKSLVEISKGSKSMEEQAIIHEILHLVDYVYNADKLNEDSTERLAQGLYQVMCDKGWIG